MSTMFLEHSCVIYVPVIWHTFHQQLPCSHHYKHSRHLVRRVLRGERLNVDVMASIKSRVLRVSLLRQLYLPKNLVEGVLVILLEYEPDGGIGLEILVLPNVVESLTLKHIILVNRVFSRHVKVTAHPFRVCLYE